MIDGLNDGIISRDDFRNAMIKYDPSWQDQSKEVELDEMFAAVDADGTGEVDFIKFAAPTEGPFPQAQHSPATRLPLRGSFTLNTDSSSASALLAQTE